MSKKCFFSIADNNNMMHYEKLKNSLTRFHPDVELKLFDQKFVEKFGDPHFYYRATPILAMKLFNEGYDEICKLDADQIIVNDLSEIWEGDFDVACVLNDPTYQIRLLDINPYFNNGLVVLKSKEFVLHWFRLCHSDHFGHYQFREQDLLNLLASDYMNYKVRNLDDSDKIYGESAKPRWAEAVLKDGKVVIGDKQLCVVHFGGGVQGVKGNYKIKFIEEVSDYIDKLVR